MPNVSHNAKNQRATSVSIQKKDVRTGEDVGAAVVRNVNGGRWSADLAATVNTEYYEATETHPGGTDVYYFKVGADGHVAGLDSEPSPGGTGADLGDVLTLDLTTTPPADGDTLVYDEASETWVPGAAAGGSSLTGFRVSAHTHQTFVGTTFFEPFTFEDVLYDTDDFVQPGLDSFIIPVGLGGVYEITGSAGFISVAGDDAFEWDVAYNITVRDEPYNIWFELVKTLTRVAAPGEGAAGLNGSLTGSTVVTLPDGFELVMDVGFVPYRKDTGAFDMAAFIADKVPKIGDNSGSAEWAQTQLTLTRIGDAPA